MRPQATAHLLDRGRLDIRFPALDLDCHTSTNDVSNDQYPTDIDATVPTSARDRHVLETERDEQSPDQFLKVSG